MNRKQRAAYQRVFKAETNAAIFKDAATSNYYISFGVFTPEKFSGFTREYKKIYAKIFYDELIDSRKRAERRARAKINDGIIHKEVVEGSHLAYIIESASKNVGAFKTFTGVTPISDIEESLVEAIANVLAYVERVGVKKLRGRYVTEPYAYRTGVLKEIGKAGFSAKGSEIVLRAGDLAGIWVVEREFHGTTEFDYPVLKYRIGIVGHSSEHRRSALRSWDYDLRVDQDDYYTKRQGGKRW